MSDFEKKQDYFRFEHFTVLKQEAIENLNVQGDDLFVDATFGGGGHSKFLLDQSFSSRVIGLDWDEDVVKKVAPSIEEKYKGRLKVLWGSFCQIYKLLKGEKINQVDGVLSDFGTSQHQIFFKDGFSFGSDSFLDMRMSKSHSRVTAFHVVNTFPEKELARLFFDLGQEKHSREIARKIVLDRKQKKISTAQELADLVKAVVFRVEGKGGKKTIHPATKVFQALRIFVNKELENIDNFLHSAIGVIRPGGRLVCISFHSLEDRLVKSFFREKERDGRLKILTKKAIVASPEELENNPSSRSAKMRVAEIA